MAGVQIPCWYGTSVHTTPWLFQTSLVHLSITPERPIMCFWGKYRSPIKNVAEMQLCGRKVYNDQDGKVFLYLFDQSSCAGGTHYGIEPVWQRAEWGSCYFPKEVRCSLKHFKPARNFQSLGLFAREKLKQNSLVSQSQSLFLPASSLMGCAPCKLLVSWVFHHGLPSGQHYLCCVHGESDTGYPGSLDTLAPISPCITLDRDSHFCYICSWSKNENGLWGDNLCILLVGCSTNKNLALV